MNRFIQRIKDAYVELNVIPIRNEFLEYSEEIGKFACCGIGAATMQRFHCDPQQETAVRISCMASQWIKNNSFLAGFIEGFDGWQMRGWNKAFAAGHKLGKLTALEMGIGI